MGRIAMPASTQALAAVRAVKFVKQWGSFAALRYVERHDAIPHFSEAVAFECRRIIRKGKV